MFRRMRKNKGFTLVEVAATLLISAIVIWGMHYAIVFGINHYKAALSKQIMLAEGSTMLRFLEYLVRQGKSIEVYERDDPLRSRLVIKFPSSTGTPYVELFANTTDGSLRIHDHSPGHNAANKRLLPMSIYNNNNHRRNTESFQYKLKELRFSFADSAVFNDYDNIPPDSLNRVVKIDLVMTDSDANTVSLTSYQSRFN